MTRLLPDAAFIAAMQEGLPQITDPMDAQEAENGVCAMTPDEEAEQVNLRG